MTRSECDSRLRFMTLVKTRRRRMNEDEALQRDAEHRAAALHRVGWEVGAGATIWARAVQDELTRHEWARRRWEARTSRDHKGWERLFGTALLVILAIDQVLAF